jgi:poly-gamma-glutamate synthesis protein (capsule biosynthesis protein)
VAATLTIALAGDAMLGRGVAEQLRAGRSVVADEVAQLVAAADLFVLNLECCISARGEPWPAAGKPFFFRAPPQATEVLRDLGVDAVTLANNHALDFGAVALLDTLEQLDAAGIAHAGAGADEAAAREPAVLEVDGLRLALIGVCDHAADFAAGAERPGIAYADLRHDPLPGWLAEAIRTARRSADAVLVCPHWGPNMVAGPVGHVRRAAEALCGAGATLVVGHSAHVPHGAAGRVLYDAGDFVDDYATHPFLRNDLGLLFRVQLGADGPLVLEAFPLKLDYCYTRLADADDAAWILHRFATSCAQLGAAPRRHADHVSVALAATS